MGMNIEIRSLTTFQKVPQIVVLQTLPCHQRAPSPAVGVLSAEGAMLRNGELSSGANSP
jgi:DNA-directed RNA polymerase beta subunit